MPFLFRLGTDLVQLQAVADKLDAAVVFVTLPGGARYALVGDLVWQLEGLLEREGRPWFEAKTIREDPVAFQQSLLRLSAIVTRFPQITTVPSHDARGYASIPQWSRPALFHNTRCTSRQRNG